MMTRKDYVKIAAAFARTRELLPKDEGSMGTLQVSQWTTDVGAIANALAADNPRFNRARFYKACGIEREES